MVLVNPTREVWIISFQMIQITDKNENGIVILKDKWRLRGAEKYRQSCIS